MVLIYATDSPMLSHYSCLFYSLFPLYYLTDLWVHFAIPPLSKPKPNQTKKTREIQLEYDACAG